MVENSFSSNDPLFGSEKDVCIRWISFVHVITLVLDWWFGENHSLVLSDSFANASKSGPSVFITYFHVALTHTDQNTSGHNWIDLHPCRENRMMRNWVTFKLGWFFSWFPRERSGNSVTNLLKLQINSTLTLFTHVVRNMLFSNST